MISYPVPTGTASVEKAVGVAASLGAQLFGVTFELDIRSPVGLYAHPASLRGMFAAEREKSAANARDLIALFDDIAAKRGVRHQHAIEHCPPVELTDRLVDHARLRDLSLFPLKAANHAERALVEHLVFESGRPVLLLPEDATRTLSSPYDNAVVAWDHSRPAARALGDALPLLRAAKRVHVVTIVDEKRLRRARSGADLAKHLARHGLEAIFDEVSAKGRSIGDTLEACVVERNADLLVMGAYGHSKLREFILGGATNRVLTRPPTWTLLSH